MSNKLESDVCCHLQAAPSGESYGNNRRPGSRVYGVIHFTSPAGRLPVHRDQLHAQRSVTSVRNSWDFVHSKPETWDGKYQNIIPVSHVFHVCNNFCLRLHRIPWLFNVQRNPWAFQVCSHPAEWQADGQTPYHYIDPAPHTMQAVPPHQY